MSETTPEPETLPDSEAKVFLSYSRKDRERAQSIADVLRDRNFGVFKDTDDILPTEEWRTRLEELIQEADTIVFLLSPHSAASEVCAWEVEYATSLNKRIAPIVIDDVEGDAIPPLLARLNFIFCTPRDPFENAVATLISALNTDIEWIREHTRINGLARRWSDAGKPARLLPRGQDITDMERWRDTHPADAPAVLPAQAGYIAEARAAAGRRQRNWIVGAIATTAVTAGLAVFAYFQSVEADAQRFAAVQSAAEADRQRDVAQANAAEAERQRAAAVNSKAEADRQRAVAEENAREAERQRQNALQQLASDRLRRGDRVAGLQAILSADPNAPQVATLVAGLQSAEDGYPEEWAHTALIWNDELSFLTGPQGEDQRGDLLPLAPFPAKYRDWVYKADGEKIPFVLSATGAIRLFDDGGKIIAADEGSGAFAPCMADHESGKTTVYGYTNFGYSACGLAIISVDVSETGTITRTVTRACEDREVIFPSLPGKSYDVSGVFDHCYMIKEEGQPFTPWDDGQNINPISEIPEMGHPATKSEGALWYTTGSLDPVEITQDMITHVRALGIQPYNGEMVGVLNFEGAQASGYIFPEILETDTFTAFAAITNWGGTGGEEHIFCSAPAGSPQVCAMLHTSSGYEGVAFDQVRGRVAIFGGGQSWVAPKNQAPSQRDANLWVILEPGTLPVPIAGIEAYGPLLDADFNDAGDLALLTSSAVLLMDVTTGEFEILAAVTQAEAARWVQGDVLLVYGNDRLTFVKEGAPPESIPYTLNPNDPSEDRRYAKRWLAPTDRGDRVAMGWGTDAQIFDIELRAPLSGVVTIPDPQIGSATGTLRLSSQPDGGLELRVNTRTYKRIRRSEGDIADFLDPEAPFRK